MNRMRLAEAERDDFADLLDRLRPEQWEAPSLCAGWRVRDVVAHVLSYEDLRLVEVAGLFLRGGLRFGRINELALAPLRDRTPAQLYTRMLTSRTPRGLTAGLGGGIALTDGMIHQQDIRRPLGLPRSIPEERIRPALDIAMTSPALGARRRVRGVRLVADDLDWSHGAGAEVRGPAEAVLLAAAGRTVALNDCTGDGVEVLRSRGAQPARS